MKVLRHLHTFLIILCSRDIATLPAVENVTESGVEVSKGLPKHYTSQGDSRITEKLNGLNETSWSSSTHSLRSSLSALGKDPTSTFSPQKLSTTKSHIDDYQSTNHNAPTDHVHGVHDSQQQTRTKEKGTSRDEEYIQVSEATAVYTDDDQLKKENDIFRGPDNGFEFWDVLRESQFSGFEASIEAALTDVDNELCRQETREFLRALKNLTLWATEMFDASVKYPRGILSGNIYNMGDFDECLAVKSPQNIKGKYCLARVSIKEPKEAKQRRMKTYTEPEDPFAIQLDPMASMWEQIEHKGYRWRLRRDTAIWAMCVPASCSAKDLEIVMNHVLPPLGSENGIDLSVEVRPDSCKVHSAQTFKASDWTFCIIVVIIITNSIFATIYDHRRGDTTSRPTPLQALILCFSMRKNFMKLHRLESNKDGLRIMFGIRVLSMFLVILGHKFGVTIGGATTNGQSIEEGNRNPAYMMAQHGDLVVDTFFAVGAFVLVYSSLRDLEAKRNVSLGVMYFLRYIRLTPAYAFIIFFYATILNKIGSGPLWNGTVAYDAEFCAEKWWANLLYISNYVSTDKMCMIHSWYLPCDMHYFTISGPLLLLLWKRPRIGQLLLGLLTILSIAAPFAITMIGGHDATILFYSDFLSNPRTSRYFHDIYIKSHTRAGPYMAGFIAGYIFHKYKLYERKISETTAYGMFIMSLAIICSITFSGVVFYFPDVPYNALNAAAYASLQRFGWGVAISLLIISVSSGKIGFVSGILCWTPFVALGKLTYCAYLIHFVFQLIKLGSDRYPNYVTNYNMLFCSVGDAVLTFWAALILYLMIEAPFRDLGRLLIMARRQPHKKTIEDDGKRNTKGNP